MNRQRLQTAGAVITLAMLGAGCAPFATYPPIEVTAGMAQPVYEPFPTLMARAIEYTRTEFCDESQELVYSLPAGSTPQLYRMVTRRLGGGRSPQQPGERAIHVETVRTRGVQAEVDVVYPRSDLVYELVTISFRDELLKGWHILGARPWNLQVEPPTTVASR